MAVSDEKSRELLRKLANQKLAERVGVFARDFCNRNRNKQFARKRQNPNELATFVE
jgi:hypothetical protein